MKARLLPLFLILIIQQQLKSGEEVKGMDKISQVFMADQRMYKPFLQLPYDRVYNQYESKYEQGFFDLTRRPRANLCLQQMLVSYPSSVNENISYLNHGPDGTNVKKTTPLWCVWLKKLCKSTWMPRTSLVHRICSKLSSNKTDEDLFKELLTKVYSDVLQNKKEPYKEQCSQLKQLAVLRSKPSFLEKE